ncbi:hypothetical protein [uncultured Dokdonia sp.]|uniref:hypothetical protein n=1 Tax=uncultured Dokdonia sp. TaxID=575653 RepID=UPI00261CD017|nr:hypothetical protein [uncultured Dokdonia sp.]
MILKIIQIGLCLLMLSCASTLKPKENDLERYELNGKVKSYTKIISYYRYYSNDTVIKNIKTNKYEELVFNEKKQLIQKNSFYRTGELYKKIVYVYDKNYNNVKRIIIKIPSDTISKSIEKFDLKGNNIESFIYDGNDSLISHSQSVFHKDNNQTRLLILKSKESSNPLLKVAYKYDDKGNEIETIRHYKNKTQTHWYTKYDSKGNEIEWIVNDNQGNQERRDVTIYDENSNPIEEKTFDSENRIDTHYISKYDDSGNEIESREYFKDSTYTKNEYIYDDLGNEVELRKYDTKGNLNTIWKTKYQYDNYKNLIKKSLYKNDRLETVRSFEIKYFEK